MTSTRRHVLKTGLAAAAAVNLPAALAAAAPAVHRRRHRLVAGGAEYTSRALQIMERAIVVDMLSPLNLDVVSGSDWLRDPSTFTERDYDRFMSSGISVFHAAVGVGGYSTPELEVSGYIGANNGLIAAHPDWFMRIDSADDFARAKESKRIGVLLGIQNSNHFTRQLDAVNQFWSLGQRVSQLTYNSRNRIGNGSTERVDGGISDWGVAVIARMNEVGIAVDTSHCGDQTTLDAFDLSNKPVLITHSNCRVFVNGHPRTKTDEAIRKMGASGGVMGITGVRNFVFHSEPTTIEHMLDHYDHVAQLVGVEHVGLGSDIDLDGYDDMDPQVYESLKAAYKDTYAFRDKIDIEGVDHPLRCFDLTDGLIRRGYSDDDIVGILGGNFIRVLGEIWDVPVRDDAPTA